MFNKIEKCLCCGGDKLELLLDLNSQPLANSYHNNTEKQQEYPLGVNLCKNCYHIQLTHAVNPDLLFKNYLYVSGTTKTLLENFKWFAKFVKEYSPNIKNVLDIACNDGSQLDAFKEQGIETYGVDPAENLYKLSSKNHNIVCNYFKKGLFDQKFDAITAQNVFAHNDSPLDFLQNCSQIMHEDSLLFIQTSQAEMILNNQFDTIYHEHISFFNINSMNELAKRSELNLINVIKTPVHGISYLFILSKKAKNQHLIANLIDVEKQKGLLSDTLYENYKNNITNLVEDFYNKIKEYKSKNYKIIGYGAAAKGMTFLNFSKCNMDIIIDDNPLKHNLYTPGTNTLITSIDYLNTLNENDKVIFVPLAWNFFDEIVSKVKNIRNNKKDIFVKYFPKLELLNI